VNKCQEVSQSDIRLIGNLLGGSQKRFSNEKEAFELSGKGNWNKSYIYQPIINFCSK